MKHTMEMGTYCSPGCPACKEEFIQIHDAWLRINLEQARKNAKLFSDAWKDVKGIKVKK
jgi:hypothetical protein